ncbi:uncharacterized protein LOC127388112 isoform X2 [Apus apus]|uniref:uncharacterized protein LOC127388112 isoform X2 n=1 Tax=Apus apus TaxID=8895 RepID=UPI0021F8C39A|nr:uncharacterized protein LOC127388112 isoform X2 [Apus apus]
MVCERISVCLGRKLFDPQKSQTTSRAREANLRSMHVVISSVISFTMHSAQTSEFCLTDQLNGFPKSTEFSVPDSAPVARTFMAAVSFAVGSVGGKKKKKKPRWILSLK